MLTGYSWALGGRFGALRARYKVPGNRVLLGDKISATSCQDCSLALTMASSLARSTDRSLANPPLLEPSISLDTPEIYCRGSLELVLRLSSELYVSSRIRKSSRAII